MLYVNVYYIFILAFFFYIFNFWFILYTYTYYFGQSLHIEHRMAGRKHETETTCIGRTLFVWSKKCSIQEKHWDARFTAQ